MNWVYFDLLCNQVEITINEKFTKKDNQFLVYLNSLLKKVNELITLDIIKIQVITKLLIEHKLHLTNKILRMIPKYYASFSYS